jgi:hypothetical protein
VENRGGETEEHRGNYRVRGREWRGEQRRRHRAGKTYVERRVFGNRGEPRNSGVKSKKIHE